MATSPTEIKVTQEIAAEHGLTAEEYGRVKQILGREPNITELGICNGFQILLEAGLLPGAMMRNSGLRFICRHVHIRVEQTDTPFTNAAAKGQILKIPIAHSDGNYNCDEATVAELEKNRQVIFRYTTPDGSDDDAGNPNGAVHNIAGVCNRERNVAGLMPHPERAVESNLGSSDGLVILRSMVEALVGAAKATA